MNGWAGVLANGPGRGFMEPFRPASFLEVLRSDLWETKETAVVNLDADLAEIQRKVEVLSRSYAAVRKDVDETSSRLEDIVLMVGGISKKLDQISERMDTLDRLEKRFRAIHILLGG